jgi:hypothetical protein
MWGRVRALLITISGLRPPMLFATPSRALNIKKSPPGRSAPSLRVAPLPFGISNRTTPGGPLLLDYVSHYGLPLLTNLLTYSPTLGGGVCPHPHRFCVAGLFGTQKNA